MAGKDKRYQTLDEDDDTEAETSLRTVGTASDAGPTPRKVLKTDTEKDQLVTSRTHPNPSYTEPKISGKGWGRVYKFFSGIREYPKAIPFIIGNEFCERFTYYGMRAVLGLFLKDFIGYTENSSTALYHAFIMLCYASPLIGAMIADGYIGKYRTILYLSVVYAIGNISLAGTSVRLGNETASKVLPLIGLLLIAFGTGGIKPCVAAFGGDQFRDDQAHLLPKYFSMFYFAINAGSLASTLLTPELRSIRCFDAPCFLLAFGLPAGLMVVAIIIFVAGNKLYYKREPQGNVIAQTARAIVLAIRRACANRKSLEKKDHWIYWADNVYERAFLDDVRSALRVFLLLLPVPIFWTLFDQTGSRWTFQAKRMDGKLGAITIKPDQMQVLNSALILIFIPLFETVIYPALRFCRLPMRPLQRMSMGMIFAGLSFVAAALVQIRLESVTDAYPANNIARFQVVNTMPVKMDVLVTRPIFGDTIFNQTVPYDGTTGLGDFEHGPYDIRVSAVLAGQPLTAAGTFNMTGRSVDSLVVAYNTTHIHIFKLNHDVAKLGGEEFAISFVNCNPQQMYSSGVYVQMSHIDRTGVEIELQRYNFNYDNYTRGIGLFEQSIREVINPPARDWSVEVLNFDTNASLHNSSMVFENGAQYTLYLLPPPENSTAGSGAPSAQLNVHPANLHVLWQAPQYAILTAGEIMFSITGLEFAYSQAPKSMKSVMQAVWLLTVAIGNLFVIIIAESKLFASRVSEFFFFAGLTIGVTFIFVILSLRYTYVDEQVDEGGSTRVERYTLLEEDKAQSSS